MPYSTAENRAIWHCKCDCGGEKDVIGKLLRNGHTHSCGCSNSKGEVLLRNIFINMGIDFEEQKTFDNFVNSRNVHYKFDFYLPNYNCCVEYDGEQHYVGWAHKKDSLKQIQQNDAIKTQYCIDNKISLVRFPYFCYDSITQKSVEDMLRSVQIGRVPQVYSFGENGS